MEFNKLWSFKARHQQIVTEPSHYLTIRFKNDGIYYGVEPELADWPNQWQCFGQDSASISLLNQIEELGHLDPLENQLFLSWDSLYQLLGDQADSSNELLKLLKLPEFSDLRPSLASQGSLEDLDFRITLSDWISPLGNKLQIAPEVTGAVIQYQDHQSLLPEAVWRLVSEVRTFLFPTSRKPNSTG